MSAETTSQTQTASSLAPDRFIRFRLTAIDTVQADVQSYPEPEADHRPGVPFVYRHSPLYGPKVALHKAPEIRVWGATDQGQRCCVHIHGALPYLYVEYSGSLDPESVQTYIKRLGQSLNLTMFYSFRGRSGNNKRAEYDPKRDQYIGYIVLCKGIPFYGFHVGYKYFLKIYALQPKFMYRLSEILRAGKVLQNVNKAVSVGAQSTTGEEPARARPQPAPAQVSHRVYEAHIPFLLQFMLDFNLYGCHWIELSQCVFRGHLPPPGPDDASNGSGKSGTSHRVYNEATVPGHFRFREGEPRRVSPSSALEFDCHVSDILNREAVEPRNLHQDFTEFLEHPVPDDAKLVQSVKGVWDDERQRRKERGEKGPFEEPDASASQRKYQQGETPEWADSKRYRDIFESMLQEDKKRFMSNNGGKWPPDFRTFCKKSPWDDWIPTTFQSVVALFPSTMEKDEALGQENPYGVWAAQGIGVSVPKSRAASEDPMAGIEREALQDLAVQVTQGNRGATGAPPGSPRSDDEAVQPAHYRDDDASEATDDEEPLVDDEEIDDLLLQRDQGSKSRMATGSAPSSDVGDGQEEQPREDDAQANAISSPPPLPDEASTLAILKASKPQPKPQVEDGLLDHLSDVDMNTSDMFTSSPHLRDQAQPMVRMASRDKPTASGNRPRNLFSSSRRSRSRSSSTVSSSSALEPDFVPGQQEPAREVESEPEFIDAEMLSAVEQEEARATRAATEPVYKLSSTMTQGEAPTQLLTGESSGVLSPTQIVTTQSPIVQKRARDEDDTVDPAAPKPSPVRPVKAARIEDPSPPQPFALDHRLSQQSTNTETSHTLSLSQSMKSARSERVMKFALVPPTKEALRTSMPDYSRHDGRRWRPLSEKRFQDPYFSDPREVPKRIKEYAGTAFRIPGSGTPWLLAFPHDSTLPKETLSGCFSLESSLSTRRWEYAVPPPDKASCKAWLRAEETSGRQQAKRRRAAAASQIKGATQANPFGFKFTQFKAAASSAARDKEHMAVLALEMQCASRGGKMPDPEVDEIIALFYCLYTDTDGMETTPGAREGCLVGCIIQAQWEHSQHTEETLFRLGLGRYAFEVVSSELEVINTLVDKVTAWDPEVLVGFEIQNGSWGYLLERAQKEYDMQLIKDLSRVIEQSTGRNEGKADAWHYTKSSTIKITGRHVLPIWRVIKGDVALLQYSFENIVFHVLHMRTPSFSQSTLYRWMIDGNVRHLSQAIQYWLSRVEMDLAIIEDSEVISSKTEFARIYGIDFASVLNRGSQFRVESVMFRIAKPESFVLLSPSREEVGRQNALEAMPLIAEPRSAFYKDPVVVLDFQSLYPSVMIGYNYCYSTCLGRVGKFKGTPKFGVVNLYLPDGLLNLLKDHITISPNGFIFVKPVVRRSLLAKMLSELLSTRVMVKSSMKLIKSDKALTRIYNARQLGLKLLANVTYGYTSATFSGRMPCAEIADAIVQTGRESLERARDLVHRRRDWGADVVYGDTDSLFIWLPGKTKESAFKIGYDMADMVTGVNPVPVKLKFEKVYLPSLLASKKRYVGFKFESLSEAEASLDAKGIEVIRRDGFPAMQKMVETCLKILFKTQDLSQVKSYCERQWAKFYLGSVSPQDFIFAKEVKPGSYSENGIPPPGAVIARNRLAKDHRDEVQYGERVPFIVPEGYGAQSRLVDRAVEPLEFLEDERHRIDAAYHIKHTIAALNRIFTLLGIDTREWASKMPKAYRVAESTGTAAPTASQFPSKGQPDLASVPTTRTTIDKFYRSDRCLSCDTALEDTSCELCPNCAANPASASFQLLHQATHPLSRRADLQKICAACAGHPQADATECVSIACPILYARKMNERAVSSSVNRVIGRTWTVQDLKAMSADM